MGFSVQKKTYQSGCINYKLFGVWQSVPLYHIIIIDI